MFLLPRILFIVCWWARFDTLASWVDWFPIHTRPLFVMCLVTFASVLFGAIALIPLCGHSPQIQKKKKTSNFLIISAERWVIAIPCKQSLHSSGGFRGGARGTRAPTLFLDQTDSRRAEKSFFGDLPPSPYLRVWMTPPPPYLKVWIRYCIFVEWVKCVAVLFARQYTPRKCVRSQGRRLVHKFLDN